jgi:ADP-ribose pyrophosphatase YjhB (NUDIX family)
LNQGPSGYEPDEHSRLLHPAILLINQLLFKCLILFMKKRPSVQAIIVDEKQKKLLIIKQLDFGKKILLWRLVKGAIDKGETERQALRREIKEEVGLRKIKIVDKIYSYKYVFRSKKVIVSTYLVKASMNDKIVLQNEEGEDQILDFKWATKGQAIRMLYWKDEKEVIRLIKI